jgi:hypothetical protein
LGCLGWVGRRVGGGGVDEEEVFEAGYVEEDGFVVEEELGEEGEVLAEELVVGGGLVRYLLTLG